MERFVTKAGEMVECPECRVTFRATKHHKKYCCEFCTQEAKRKRNTANKRRQRGGVSWDEYLEQTGKESTK